MNKKAFLAYDVVNNKLNATNHLKAGPTDVNRYFPAPDNVQVHQIDEPVTVSDN